MTDCLKIQGGNPLRGSIRVQGSKNAALPLMAAAVMAKGRTTLCNVPDLADIRTMILIIESLGGVVERSGDQLILDTGPIHSNKIPEEYMRKMRSSLFLLGPLIARFGGAEANLPGGCAIGERKIDIHLSGFEQLGAFVQMDETQSNLQITVGRLTGANIRLSYPSVGATENLMMAAALAKGETIIFNAACEPEVQDLQAMLNQMGANIEGAGTTTIRIQGVERLEPVRYHVIPDRIAAGTWMIAAGITRGELQLEGVRTDHIGSLIHVLKQSGVEITRMDAETIRVRMMKRPKAVERITTAPYPLFPTDLQAQLMVFFTVADGKSIMRETVFERRFQHVEMLRRMSAEISVSGSSAVIQGISRLNGAQVRATDLRAGAGLILAGLAARGTTILEGIHHVDRGYEHVVDVLSACGADIQRTKTSLLLTETAS